MTPPPASDVTAAASPLRQSPSRLCVVSLGPFAKAEPDGLAGQRRVSRDRPGEMKARKQHVLLLWMLVCSGRTEAIEPISTSIAVGMAAALTGFLASYQNILYYFHECCRSEWISFNRTGATRLLRVSLALAATPSSHRSTSFTFLDANASESERSFVICTDITPVELPRSYRAESCLFCCVASL